MLDAWEIEKCVPLNLLGITDDALNVVDESRYMSEKYGDSVVLLASGEGRAREQYIVLSL